MQLAQWGWMVLPRNVDGRTAPSLARLPETGARVRPTSLCCPYCAALTVLLSRHSSSIIRVIDHDVTTNLGNTA